MDKVLRPERFETDPSSNLASKEWLHWKRTFVNILSVLPQENLDKLSVLANFVSPTIFLHIEDSTDYDAAMEILESLFIKPKNEIFARHVLATRRQQPSETLDEYLQALKTLSKDCNFKDVTAALYCEESIRDAFITGLQSSHIRQRLLENKTLDLKTAFDQAPALELAMRSSETYTVTQPSVNAAVPTYSDISHSPTELPESRTVAAMEVENSCFFCGNARHPRSKCPARDVTCLKCQKKGHFAKVCRGKPANPRGRISAAVWSPSLATVPTIPTSPSRHQPLFASTGCR
ncbi:Retrovirus-related Pol poly from transposon opus [Paramuricea clavata]|uniref:Retrovirus-related Pol poly from transposon opus n=1 Tax=Paramuricea clavata TaxID=317549 RepID=A0A6S7J163_PARCT|nr:Retrovirus-related Pol poly from transposon opus [Paramuricea clavata]